MPAELDFADAYEAELARRNHLDFMRFCWTKQNPLIVGYHTDAICSIIDEAIADYREGRSTYLFVKVPFRHGKSDIVSRYLPAHFLGEFPHAEMILATYLAALSRSACGSLQGPGKAIRWHRTSSIAAFR